MITKSAHVILVYKDKILLSQRNDVPIWVIPGGTLEKGETPVNCAIREIKEELGIDIENPKLIARYIFNNKCYKNLYVYYFKESFDQKIQKSNEVKNYNWFYPIKLPKLISLHEIDKINDYLNHNKTIIEKKVFINKKQELNHLLKNPLNFAYILFYLVINKLRRGSFKI